MPDFKLDQNLDPVLEGGDFALDDTPDRTDKHLLLLCSPGNWRAFPLAGTAILRQLNAPMTASDRARLQARIRAQFEADGFVVNAVELSGNDIDTLQISDDSFRPPPRV